jgi:hypothetical protein
VAMCRCLDVSHAVAVWMGPRGGGGPAVVMATGNGTQRCGEGKGMRLIALFSGV